MIEFIKKHSKAIILATVIFVMSVVTFGLFKKLKK